MVIKGNKNTKENAYFKTRKLSMGDLSRGTKNACDIIMKSIRNH